MKRLAARERRRLVRDADRAAALAVGPAHSNGMVAVIGAIELSSVSMCRPWARLNRPSPQLVTKLPDRSDHHRMGAAVEDVDAVLAVDRDGGGEAGASSRWQFRPVLHHAVAMLARAENGRHACFPPMFLFDSRGCRGRLRHARQQAFLDRLDLQREMLRADAALREAAGDEPQAGLSGARIHVA